LKKQLVEGDMKKVLVLVTVLVFMLMAFAGCSAPRSAADENADYYAEGEMSQASAEAPQAAEGAPQEDMAVHEPTAEEEAAPVEGDAGLNYDNSILSPGVNRKIIYYGSFSIRTKDFDNDYDSLLATLEKLGGYIEASSVSGSKPDEWNESGRYANLTLRVPSSKFSEFTSKLGDFGETVSKSVSGQDISLQYFDTETKLKTLRARETRLLDLLDKAATLEDIIELESALAEVSYEIQMLETNLRDYDSLIDYSTVTIEMQEVNKVEAVTPPDESIGSRISGAFYSVLNVLADFGEFLLVFFIGGAPVIVPLAAITVLIIILVNRKNKKAAKKKNTTDSLK
jgi:hypothetical protein